jgi:hypothetical protein
MKPKSLWERLQYKYEYLGQVEKNGEVYKKFKKRRRFEFVKKGLKTLFYIVLFVVALLVFDYLKNTMGGKSLRR